MESLEQHDNPRSRFRFIFLLLGLMAVVLVAMWAWGDWQVRSRPPRTVALPHGCSATVAAVAGMPFEDLSLVVTLVCGTRAAEPLTFRDEAVKVRFYALSSLPDSLNMLQVNAVTDDEIDPGTWIEAVSMQILPLESLPENVLLLGEVVLQ